MIRTKEIAEAAIFYLNGFEMNAYDNKYWQFDGDEGKADKLQIDLINKKLSVEPLEFMDAIRRVKSFSNGMKLKK